MSKQRGWELSAVTEWDGFAEATKALGIGAVGSPAALHDALQILS